MAQVEDKEYEDVLVVSHIKLEGIDYCTKRLKIVCQPFGWDGLAVPNPRKRLFPERDYHKIQDIGFLGTRQDTFLITGKMHQSLCQFGALGRMNVQAIRHLDDENLVYNQLRLNFLNLSVFFYKSYTVLLQLRPKTFIWSGKELKESEPVNVCWKSSKFCYRAKVGQTVHCFRNAQTYNDRVYYITDEGELMELSFWDVVFHEKDPELIHKIKVKQSVLLAGGVDAFCISTDSREPALIIGTSDGSLKRVPIRDTEGSAGIDPRKLQKSKAWKTVKLIDKKKDKQQDFACLKTREKFILAAGHTGAEERYLTVWWLNGSCQVKDMMSWNHGELLSAKQLSDSKQGPKSGMPKAKLQADLVQDIEIFQPNHISTTFILITTQKRGFLLSVNRHSKLCYLGDLISLCMTKYNLTGQTEIPAHSQIRGKYITSRNSLMIFGDLVLFEVKLVTRQF